jgi:ribosome-associated heat shock protein Hsp15
MDAPAEKMRVDKWLWAARFFKTRGLSAGMVTAGHLRINGNKTDKAAYKVGAGDVLIFAQGRDIRVIKVLSCPARRGPAPEAQGHYQDLTPAKDPAPASTPQTETGGRPSKKARRQFDQFMTDASKR